MRCGVKVLLAVTFISNDNKLRAFESRQPRLVASSVSQWMLTMTH